MRLLAASSKLNAKTTCHLVTYLSYGDGLGNDRDARRIEPSLIRVVREQQNSNNLMPLEVGAKFSRRYFPFSLNTTPFLVFDLTAHLGRKACSIPTYIEYCIPPELDISLALTKVLDVRLFP